LSTDFSAKYFSFGMPRSFWPLLGRDDGRAVTVALATAYIERTELAGMQGRGRGLIDAMWLFENFRLRNEGRLD
jgi:hypothetical protein